jgi:cation:H+ antiporter
MFEAMSLPILLLFFTGSAAAVWAAGIRLSDSSDVLSRRLGLGQALGGLILLAISTNLPEIAITASAALSNNLELAVGNILGGIAIQTVVLVILDVFGLGPSDPLTYRAASLVLALEGLLVIAVLTVVVMASQLPPSLIFARLTPDVLLIVAFWVVGIWLIGKARRGLPWQARQEQRPDLAEDGAASDPPSDRGDDGDGREQSLSRNAAIFAIAAVVTLVGGIVLERSGEVIADRIGMSGVVFGATILAAATALPEVSTGLAAVKLEDYRLAMSDIFGGNAFLPVLFLLASVLSGEAVLPRAEATDIYLTALGALLTAVYMFGLVFRLRLQIARMGVDSLVVLVLYLLGVAGLIAIAHG